ncbi:OLC1v1012006C2 [Oldenlandia corymbosa var. corymbosa]|uniref:OLC1v1012006C2 n=1 Tax=Oldenlandia corymbosa var. corymbosa TaxID=529605 RepID=A0AAV1DY08_OLDCO|nr:OLC1v1012006C2 [Oldenlandia corymbosa var. corymbosa]
MSSSSSPDQPPQPALFSLPASFDPVNNPQHQALLNQMNSLNAKYEDGKSISASVKKHLEAGDYEQALSQYTKLDSIIKELVSFQKQLDNESQICTTGDLGDVIRRLMNFGLSQDGSPGS